MTNRPNTPNDPVLMNLSPDPALERMLDALADQESASPGLEDRVERATLPVLLASRTSIGDGDTIPFPSRGASTRGLRLAAAVAIVASVGAAYLALRPTHHASSEPILAQSDPASASIESEAELANAILTALDDGTSEQIDLLYSDTARLHDSMGQGWSSFLDGGAS